MTENRYRYAEELKENLTPNHLIDDLEERLRKNYLLTKSNQFSSVVNDKNPRTGFIEVAKPNGIHCSPWAIISNFYELRGFEILKSGDSLVEVSKGKEKYSIMIGETNTCYEIYVRETVPGL